MVHLTTALEPGSGVPLYEQPPIRKLLYSL